MCVCVCVCVCVCLCVHVCVYVRERERMHVFMCDFFITHYNYQTTKATWYNTVMKYNKIPRRSSQNKLQRTVQIPRNNFEGGKRKKKKRRKKKKKRRRRKEKKKKCTYTPTIMPTYNECVFYSDSQFPPSNKATIQRLEISNIR